MQPISELDVAVTSCQLCSLCKKLVAVFVPSKLWGRTAKESHWGTSTSAYKHYPDLESLRQSAADGCHICSLLVGGVTDRKGRDYTTNKRQLYIGQYQTSATVK